MHSAAVMDLGLGNIRSLASALSYLGVRYFVGTTRECVRNASHLILPGVGAYDAAMRRVHDLELEKEIQDHIFARGRSMLGICLGMQILFDASDEGELGGLAVVPGRFTRLSTDLRARKKVPHVGFSQVYNYKSEGLFEGLGERASFYFTHSYALLPHDSLKADIALCDHRAPFIAGFSAGRVCGVQFHPEKSQSAGLRLLRNFFVHV